MSEDTAGPSVPEPSRAGADDSGSVHGSSSGRHRRRKHKSRQREAQQYLMHQGFLTKRGGLRKNWKKRWFVMKDATLSYYEKPESVVTKAKAKGTIELIDVICQENNEMGKDHCFELVTGQRTYYFVAKDDAEMQEWIEVLRKNTRSVRAGTNGELAPAVYTGGQEVYIKVLIVGDSFVGKTALVRRWLGQSFPKKYVETDNSAFHSKSVTFEGWKCNLLLWDVAGGSAQLSSLQEKTAAILVCFDLTNFQSFGKAKKLCRAIMKSEANVVPVVVGTKRDLEDEREVDQSVGRGFAEELNTMYIETSAKDNSECDTPFFGIVKLMGRMNRFKSLPTSASELT
eukprot:TRINITY_DN1199_c0_g1_i1.p1 TRINITY_DN1199_c0_g1~~TRINITY_DN1199_c0_g1_i1.p1  ORF type:complete len:342 (-),score=76.99 TRINITY_DN1199_c0_g1_i1:118-1143(-)